MTATITNLRIEGQSLAFNVSIGGDPGGQASAFMFIYDAAGTERLRSDLGSMVVGDSWDSAIDLPAATLGDGDYGAWVNVLTKTADDQFGPTAEQGVSFLVGRGQIYPSREHADQRTFTTPPTLSPLRLEGTWVVFDMTNGEHFDLEVAHQLSIGQENVGVLRTFHGQELVRAGATQQGHYLLPDDLADGRYYVTVELRNEGSDFPVAGLAEIQIDGTAITLS